MLANTKYERSIIMKQMKLVWTKFGNKIFHIIAHWPNIRRTISFSVSMAFLCALRAVCSSTLVNSSVHPSIHPSVRPSHYKCGGTALFTNYVLCLCRSLAYMDRLLWYHSKSFMFIRILCNEMLRKISTICFVHFRGSV